MATRVYCPFTTEDGIEWECRGRFTPGELRGAPAAYYTDPPEPPMVEDVEVSRDGGATWHNPEDVFDEERDVERVTHTLIDAGMEGE